MTAEYNGTSFGDLPADLPQQAIELAAQLLQSSRKFETSLDRSRTAQMARMMKDQDGKKFTIAMTDQVLKIEDAKQSARRLDSLVRQYGLPKYLSPISRAMLWLGNKAAGIVPSIVMPLISRQVRRESAHVIVSAEPGKFERYLAKRKADKIQVNFNQLGEAVLGDREAQHRFQLYLDRLASDDIVYVSVKLSSVVSQISLTGYRETLQVIKGRLRELYRAAIQHGKGKPKFVNLDMEEYRDLQLTVDVFCQVLDEPEFQDLEAGIVLQAYLPDSFPVQQTLTRWAHDRFQKTGAGIKIRLVKGANLAMEQVEASLRVWAQAPYTSKIQVDANYKRMLEFGTRSENIEGVRLGIASHNLFDIAYAMLVRSHRGVEARVDFEMLEGMANAQALEVRQRTGSLVVYTPAVGDKDFEAAVAYLVRRLDENTSEGSFLGALFALQKDSPQWNQQREAFLQACQLSSDPKLLSRASRIQDRMHEGREPQDIGVPFCNEPDTDFSLPENRTWAQGIVERWSHKVIDTIALEIGGKLIPKQPTGIGRDPSRNSQQIYQFCEANAEQVDQALQVAVDAQVAWEALGVAGRSQVLSKVAVVFAMQRGETLGGMMVDCGKALAEGDVEVSEAIDFANYYARSLDMPGWFDGSRMKARGVVVVTPPWNFPYAIPAGGCLAALMAGNCVILKPSPEAVLTAYLLAQQLWEAGVPKDVLQFLPVDEHEAGRKLIADPRTSAVILTGSSETAKMFMSWRDRMPLYAETSGKNSMIITANADVDLAIKDLVRGAFAHAGQKCSATSLAIVQRSLYHSQKFRNQLLDAASSFVVGSSHNPTAIVTPVIREPDENLKTGLTTLSDGESWLLEPKIVDGNPCLWSPGIKLGVKPGSWFHTTECFGPVLGIICVDTLEQAIEIQNSSDFGLTAGLHSLEPQQIKLWREKVEVGNAYINRGTTGAIVQRQPFGGWKDSCVGPGTKAGGPNYVGCFVEWMQHALPELQAKPQGELRKMTSDLVQWIDGDQAKQALTAAAGSFQYWWNQEFSIEHDPSQVHGETNHFRYCKRPWHVLRVGKMLEAEVKQAVAMAALGTCRVGTGLAISSPVELPYLQSFTELTGVTWLVETHKELINRLSLLRDGTIRAIGDLGGDVFYSNEMGYKHVVREMPLANGRIELQLYLREQSISETVHRYGNIV